MQTDNSTEDRIAAMRWFALAAGALALAGMFSLALIIGRAPAFAGFFEDPTFFKRALVVHVDLALIVWFYAVVAGLFQMVGCGESSTASSNRGVVMASLGVVAMVASAGIPHAEPVLANYVPVVDHPLFVGGLVLVGLGVLSAMLSARLLGREERPGFFPIVEEARPGLRATAIALVIAALTFYGAVLTTPLELASVAYYELVAWGGGHVLQVASEAAMVSVWLVLLGSFLGRAVLGRRRAAILFALLVTPHLAMPVMSLWGTQSAVYYNGATRMMQFGIFPVVTVILALCVRELYRAHRSGELRGRYSDPRLIGFATSASLCVTGFVLGAMIRGSNTMIPAHYHAAIGAVTVAFMTVGALLLAPERFGVDAPGLLRGSSAAHARWGANWHRLQPALFGFGQLIFAIGFGLAGAHGMGRKLYGAEQQVLGLGDWLGLGIMGVGGLVAVAGGLLFLAMIAGAVVPLVQRRVRLLHRFASSSHIADPDGPKRRSP